MLQVNDEHETKLALRGCVSPLNINTWKTETGGDMDNVDGYEELSAELQEKVARAIEQGHVDDEDWKWVSATYRDCAYVDLA